MNTHREKWGEIRVVIVGVGLKNETATAENTKILSRFSANPMLMTLLWTPLLASQFPSAARRLERESDLERVRESTSVVESQPLCVIRVCARYVCLCLS